MLDTSNYFPLMPRYEAMDGLPKSNKIYIHRNKSNSVTKQSEDKNSKYKELSLSIQALKNRKLFLMKNAEKIKQLSITMQNYIEWREVILKYT